MHKPPRGNFADAGLATEVMVTGHSSLSLRRDDRILLPLNQVELYLTIATVFEYWCITIDTIVGSSFTSGTLSATHF